jgi:hypothetical protein
MTIRKDLAGQTFGHWTVLRYENGTWLCKCECGTERNIPGYTLSSGRSRGCASCGSPLVAKKYSNLHRKTYDIFKAMLQRCYVPNSSGYKHYGARGITVCDHWRYSYDNFLRDMGECPEEHSIERIDNNHGYGPGNCVWILRGKQNLNKRNNRMVTINDETACLSEWCRNLGLNHQSVRGRLRLGWSEADALLTPIKRRAHA